MAARLKGRQRPSYQLTPRHTDSYGPDAAALAEGYGMPPDPWQRLILDGWMGTLKDGRWAAGDCGVSVPRQNGKNGVIEFLELYDTAILGLKILHTAHEVKTCRKHFLRMKNYFENARQYPELAAAVDYIRNTNGQEAIVLTNGGSIEFIARSKSSGRGFTVDILVCDEAQELTDEQMEAIQPATSSAPSGNPQTIYAGTPTPPSSPGTVFERIRRTARTVKPKRTCWYEWGVEEIGDIHDRTRWAQANPSLGIRLVETVIESEVSKFTPEGFARERLGWWDESQSNATEINPDDWAACKTDHPCQEGRNSFAVKFSPDGATASLVACVRPPKGSDLKPHIELIDVRSMRNGVMWLADFLEQRWRKTVGIVIDGRVGAPTLVQMLKDQGVSSRVIVTPTSRQVADAVSMFEQAINDHRLTHFDQPGLNDAAAHAKHRKIGDGYGYEPGDQNTDVMPLEAAALAYWNQKTSRRDPDRKQRMVRLA